MNQNLNLIIADYKKDKAEHPDTWMAYCGNLENIEDVIFNAAMALDQLGRKNGHQRRLKKNDLEKFALNIIDKKERLIKIETFPELLECIESCKIKGIGDLTCYDTAVRIGAKLKIYPDKIYMHAGTKIGAERLLKRKIKEKSISRDLLPIPFHNEILSNVEIEDILCIYKNNFNNTGLSMGGCFKNNSKRCNKTIC